jgi:UDP-glucose 4-epimerase
MGGLGFIGSHLCRSLLEDGYHVTVFDKLYATRQLVTDIENKISIMEGDIAKTEDVLRSLKGIDVAIHLIHTTVPGSSMQDPAFDVQSNVVANTRWLPYLKKTGLKRIIYISSGGTVYGVPQKHPIHEDHPTYPNCSYGITKLAIENYVRLYAQKENIDYRILRPSNAYGEGQRLNIGQGVIGVFLDKALRGEPIEIWGDGTSQRDYIYVMDLVDGIKRMIHHKGSGKIFNIATEKGYSLNRIAEIIRHELQLPIRVNYLPLRGFDVPVNVLNTTLIKRQTGWAPKVNLINGVRRFHDYLKKQSNRRQFEKNDDN